MSLYDEFRIDRTAISVGQLGDPDDEKAYWLSRTPEERWTALEYLRQVAYGYDPDTCRLQRVLEVTQRAEG